MNENFASNYKNSKAQKDGRMVSTHCNVCVSDTFADKAAVGGE